MSAGELSADELSIAVLANMRELYRGTLNNPPEVVALKREYSGILQTMVKSMKEICHVIYLFILYVLGGAKVILGAVSKVCARRIRSTCAASR